MPRTRKSNQQQPRPRRAGRARILAAALAASIAPAAAGAAGPWAYERGAVREEQQGNFCDTRDDAAEIAGIFRRFSPRTGYAALAAAPGCEIAVRTFTPRALMDEIVISEGKDNEYRVRFIEVRTDDGRTLYLVTTRAFSE